MIWVGFIAGFAIGVPFGLLIGSRIFGKKPMVYGEGTGENEHDHQDSYSGYRR